MMTSHFLMYYNKLCLLQDQYANSLMHDANMTFRVPLHRMVGAAAVSVCTLWVDLSSKFSLFSKSFNFEIRPDITVMVDWALKINYLSINFEKV